MKKRGWILLGVLLVAIILVLFLIFKGKEKFTNARGDFSWHTTPDTAVVINEDISNVNINIDTLHYYRGFIHGNEYIIKMLFISKDSLHGCFYLLDDSPILHGNSFSVKYSTDKTYLYYDDKELVLKLNLEIDSNKIVGRYAINKNFWFFERFSWIETISFSRYTAPDFQLYTSNRYKVPLYEVQTIKDVVYGNSKGYWTSLPENETNYFKILRKGLGQSFNQRNLDLTMDIYMPVDEELQKHPLIMFIHGGGFYVGDKQCESMVRSCTYFASLGYVTVSINYRMGFQLSKKSIERTGYKAVQDAHAAMRYLIKNQNKYQIDTNYIFVGGASAGAITSLNLAFMTNESRPESSFKKVFSEELGNIEKSGNTIDATFHVKAVANMWGALPNLECLEGKKTNVISFHGTADQVVPCNYGYPFSEVKGKVGEMFFEAVYGSSAIQTKMNELGLKNQTYLFDGMGHALYQDKNQQLNDNFIFILDHINDFFYKELIDTNLQITTSEPQYYVLSNPNISLINWQAKGGLILEENHHQVRVVWLDTEPQHILTAAGKLSNGTSFCKELIIKSKKEEISTLKDTIPTVI